MHHVFEKNVKLLLGIIVDFRFIPPTCGFEGCPLLGRYVLVLSYTFPCGTPYILVLQRNKCILDVKCRTLLLTFGNYCARLTVECVYLFRHSAMEAKVGFEPTSVTVFKRCGATQRIRTFWIQPT